MKNYILYRMTLDAHLCPSGLKLRHYLQRKKIPFEDRPLKTRAEVDAIKAKYDVTTTPLLLDADETIIGGYEASRTHFGDSIYAGRSYRPVLIIFLVAALLALSVSYLVTGGISWRIAPWFISLAMVLLGVQKLRDIESFTSMFLLYDLLAQRWVPYARIYPVLETTAGLFMFVGIFTPLIAPVMFIAASIGAYSVYKAVWMDGRDLRCACTGGSTNVPLGPVSLLENVMMMVMSAGMLIWG